MLLKWVYYSTNKKNFEIHIFRLYNIPEKYGMLQYIYKNNPGSEMELASGEWKGRWREYNTTNEKQGDANRTLSDNPG